MNLLLFSVRQEMEQKFILQSVTFKKNVTSDVIVYKQKTISV